MNSVDWYTRLRLSQRRLGRSDAIIIIIIIFFFIIIIIIIIIKTTTTNTLKIERKSNASGNKKIISVFCHCSILRTLSLVINIIIIVTIITTIVFSI